MPLTASLIAAGVSAAVKGGTGIGQLIHSKKLGKSAVLPSFDIQQEYFDNRDIAASMAQRGLTDKALNYYTSEAERGLGSATGALLQSGGGINSFQQLYDTFGRGTAAVATEDAELQNKNILHFMDRNDVVAKQKVQKWVIEKYQPYKDTVAAAASERAAGLQNITGALNEGAAAAASYGMGKNYEDLLNAGKTTAGTGTAVDTPGDIGIGKPVTPPANLNSILNRDPYQVVVNPPAQQQQQQQPGVDLSQLNNDEVEMLRNLFYKLNL